MGAGFPWNGSELLSREYGRDNYRIIRTGAKTGRAIIFFSSNGIYYPNEEAVYIEAIITNDRYEWEHIAKNRMIRRHYELLVFVRDIYKQWYVTGINSRYDTADKTADFLRELTRGMKVTTCGNSAGGYAAVLFAHLMGAEKFFSVSGQFSILHQLNNPLVGKYYSDPSRSKYYNIATFAGGGGYYFWPSKSDGDQAQNAFVKDITGLVRIPFTTKMHGSTMPSFCLPYILTRNSEQLSRIFTRIKNDEVISPYRFAWRAMPLHLFVKGVLRKTAGFVWRTAKKLMRL